MALMLRCEEFPVWLQIAGLVANFLISAHFEIEAVPDLSLNIH